ncbi:MAG: type II secretion system F family protein, partial [Gemmatimonadota bacterium]
MTTTFHYRASTADGQVVEGVVQAASEPTAIDELRRQRLYPIDVAPVSATRSAVRGRSLNKPTALALFARTVATLLGAGVPLERAIAFAAQQARHPDVANAARAVQSDLQGGAALSEAVARHRHVFSPLFVAMVAAGEEGGTPDESMSRLADHLEELVELRGQIRTALLYPALMGVV